MTNRNPFFIREKQILKNIHLLSKLGCNVKVNVDAHVKTTLKCFRIFFFGKVATFGDHSLIGLEVIQRFSEREGLNRVKLKYNLEFLLIINNCSYGIFNIL